MLQGELQIDMPDGTVTLGPGQMFIVPKGVEHRPRAVGEVHLLLIEPTGTPNSGDVQTAAPRRVIGRAPMELVPVGEDLAWVAGVAAEHHGLVFNTEAMLTSDISDRSKFYVPNGRFYLLRDAQAFVGVGALQRVDATTAEIQRMVVQPPWRGRGAARLLRGRLLDDARAMGCGVVRLESLKCLAPAHALYRSVGFVDVPPHDDNRMRHYQEVAALDAYRDSAVLMVLRWR